MNGATPAPGPTFREVTPPASPLRGRVRVPGSKSLAARALLAASLSEGESAVSGDLSAGDLATLEAGLRALGVRVRREGAGEQGAGESRGHDEQILRVAGLAAGDLLPAEGARIDAGDAGTAARFLSAVAGLARGPVVVDGSARMRERPMRPLLEALASLGCPSRPLGRAGCLPIEIAGGGLAGGACRLSGSLSSQFLSALLIAGCRAGGPAEIVVEGPLVSRPYADLTVEVLRAFGHRVEGPSPEPAGAGGGTWRVEPSAGRARPFRVEPDASSAAFAFAAAAITGGEIEVEGLFRSSRQPDAGVLDLLEEMGCRVVQTGGGTRLAAGPLKGIRAVMTDLPDSVPALAAVAPFASGPTEISGVAHLRVKESDRLSVLAREMKRLGVRVAGNPDGLTIEPAGPGSLRGAEVDPAGDHRMAMALALIGLRVPGVRVRDPGCVAKSFPGFWEEIVQRAEDLW